MSSIMRVSLAHCSNASSALTRIIKTIQTCRSSCPSTRYAPHRLGDRPRRPSRDVSSRRRWPGTTSGPRLITCPPWRRRRQFADDSSVTPLASPSSNSDSVADLTVTLPRNFRMNRLDVILNSACSSLCCTPSRAWRRVGSRQRSSSSSLRAMNLRVIVSQ